MTDHDIEALDHAFKELERNQRSVAGWTISGCTVPDGWIARHRNGGEWVIIVGAGYMGENPPRDGRIQRVLSGEGTAPPPIDDLVSQLGLQLTH